MLKGYLGSGAVDLRRDFPMTQKTKVKKLNIQQFYRIIIYLPLLSALFPLEMSGKDLKIR